MATKVDKKNAIRQGIIEAAIVYSQSLAGKTFLYVYGDEYFEVSFPVDHFLHLTGVETRLSAKDFYRNAKKAILTNNQFYFDARHIYANAKKNFSISDSASYMVIPSKMVAFSNCSKHSRKSFP